MRSLNLRQIKLRSGEEYRDEIELELEPFEVANQSTALVAASLYTLKRGLPPVSIDPELRPAYRTGSFTSCAQAGGGSGPRNELLLFQPDRGP